MKLDREQQDVLNTALGEARRFNATPKETKALVEALIVESSIRNLNHGLDDSLGPLQQRPSQGWSHPRNITLATRDFLTHARAISNKYGDAGSLAQGVQRSGFPARYGQVSGQADQLLSQYGTTSKPAFGGNRGDTSSPSMPQTQITQQTVPDEAARKRVVLAQFLQRVNPTSPLLRLGVVSPTEATTKVQQQVQEVGTPAGRSTKGQDASALGDVLASTVMKRANAINAQHLKYKWGGGHQGKTPLHQAVPLDCSGAVSKVLGIDPRVAAQFKTFGKPGDGGKHGVTIYAKDSHVLMKIDGHFFGTSRTNPGGGAGWIKQQDISPAYLAGFTVRHV